MGRSEPPQPPTPDRTNVAWEVIGPPPPLREPSAVGFATDERVRLAVRLIVHLATLAPPVNPTDEASARSTQEGIAGSLSASQGAVSKVLRRLIAVELVRSERRYVPGRRRRFRVYFLTAKGTQLAARARAKLPEVRWKI